MTDRLNRTSICSIVFLDIIDYSKKPVSEQVEDKTFFNNLINEAIQNVAPNDRVILDTGDGAAITLMGAPEEALFIALTIRDGILEHNKGNPLPILVRIGINLGSIRVMKDLNDRPNIIGDGINVAQRIMSFADVNQILVSRSYYEVTSRLTKEITSMFSYSGIKQDKHIREHEVYIIKSKEESVPTPQAKPAFYTIDGMKFTGKKLATTYFLPMMVVGLFVALVTWYLLVLRPIPFAGEEPNKEERVSPVVSVPTKSLGTSAVKKQDKAETKTKTMSESASSDNKMQTPTAATANVKPETKSPVKPVSKPHLANKSYVKKEKPIEHNNSNSVSAETTSNHEKTLATKPVLKHICTQAEIAMNQCK